MRPTDHLAALVISGFSRTGSIRIGFPDHSMRVIGDGEPVATVTVVDRAAYGAVLRSGLLGFTEAYMDGAVEVDDLEGFLRWGAENHARWGRELASPVVVPIRALWQRLGRERRHEAVQSMTDHYNLGNDFYAAWLDPGMSYSSARFTGPNATLESAQQHKYDTVARHAGLRPGMRVLEIGCGWGGFAEYAAAEHGVEVVGLTIAEEQAVFARKRIASAGVANAVDILLEDFRLIDGEFDAVVSIEMIESIDETAWPTLFTTIRDRLRPGGRAVLQAITISDALFAGYRDRRDFIQRYIFPGGQLPSPSRLRDLGRVVGLEVEAVETFGLDYARTLVAWRDRFRSAWPELRTLGLDERFRRMWDLYLTYCEAGFRTGALDVEQWVFSRS